MNAARLKSIPLFAGLSERERERIAHWADEVDVRPGKHLVDEGNFAYEFFVIEKGSAEVLKGGEKIAELSEGDFFGEIALSGADRRTASVVARDPMTVIVMTGRDFKEMEDEMPGVAEKINAAVRERQQR